MNQEDEKIKIYFDSAANIYKNRSKKGLGKWLRQQEATIIKQSLKVELLDDVLELGSGTGYYSRYIYDLGCKSLTCVDFSSRMLKKIDIPGCIKVNANIQNYLSENYFDIILCAGVLEFLEHPEIVFNNVVQMLKPNGFIIILMPRYSFFGKIYQLYHRLHGFRIKLFKKEDLQRWLEKTNLNIVEYKKVSLFSIFCKLSLKEK